MKFLVILGLAFQLNSNAQSTEYSEESKDTVESYMETICNWLGTNGPLGEHQLPYNNTPPNSIYGDCTPGKRYIGF